MILVSRNFPWRKIFHPLLASRWTEITDSCENKPPHTLHINHWGDWSPYQYFLWRHSLLDSPLQTSLVHGKSLHFTLVMEYRSLIIGQWLGKPLCYTVKMYVNFLNKSKRKKYKREHRNFLASISQKISVFLFLFVSFSANLQIFFNGVSITAVLCTVHE